VAVDARQIEYEVDERPIGAIVGAIVLTMAMCAVGFVPIFVGIGSERRDPGGGYVALGVLTGVAHLVLGLAMLMEVLFTVGTGRGKTLGRLAHKLGRVSFFPTVDFMLGLVGVGFGTIYMLAFTQTIADMPRLPSYAQAYTSDGWLGVWIVWASVLTGCFFWSMWLDGTLGRDPHPRRDPLPAADDEYDDYEDDEE
jgi:hypothetical protein